MDEKDKVSTNNTTVDKKEFYIPTEYVKSKVTPSWLASAKSRGAKYTREQIKLMLLDPVKNHLKLQQLSRYLWTTSPVYQQIVLYTTSLLTFDYILYPDNIKNKSTLKDRLLSSAKMVKQSQVKSNFVTLLLRSFIHGEVYVYQLSDNDNTIFKEIPTNVCELAMIDDDNLWRYYVNLALITPSIAYELPYEIQNAYFDWVSRGKNKKKVKRNIEGMEVIIPDNYYLVGKNGYAIFSHGVNTVHDYPYFASMFPDLITLEDDKEYFNEFLKESNLKLIHMQIPVDDEGKPLMDYNTVLQYHESTKQHVPANVKVATNPFKMEGITMDKGQQQFINIVEHSDKIVKSDSGISSTIFEANTTNGLIYSTAADANKIYPLLSFFENIVNYSIKRYKYKVTFLQVNRFDVKEWHAQYATDLALGGSRFLFISTSGLEIYDYLMLAEIEKEMGIEELFAPKMSANQMSSNDGRPEMAEGDKSDSTVEVQGTQ